MVKRNAPIRVTTFLLLATCAGLCQMHPSTELDSPNAQQTGAWSSLPDAPLPVESTTQAERSHGFIDKARSPLTHDSAGPRAELEYSIMGAPPSSLSESLPVHKESGASSFLDKFLHPSPKPEQLHFLSTDGSFVNRSFSAASRLLLTRDDSGKARLNTSYFLGVLTVAAVHTAYRPYWARSTGAVFNDFGSTVGGDAGINVFHEFEPGIRQVMKGHIPRFVSKIEERVTHGSVVTNASSR